MLLEGAIFVDGGVFESKVGELAFEGEPLIELWLDVGGDVLAEGLQVG